MRVLIFAKRNIKEISRDILSLIFCLGFPIVLFLVFQVIIASIPGDGVAQTPQFLVESLAPSMIIFGFSFITLFSGMLIAKDRTTSFQSRLNSSPMKPIDFILGYTLPLLIIALIQIVLIFCVAFIFKLQFTYRIFLTLIVGLPSALLFIGLGLLIGSLFNDKAVGGISAIIVNFAAILGGMFFPLANMSGAIVTITNIFPFVHAINLIKYTLEGNYSGMLMPLLVVLAYIVVIFALAIFVFYKKLKSDKK